MVVWIQPAMRLPWRWGLYMSVCVFLFFFGFGNMVERRTLTLAVVQRLKRKSNSRRSYWPPGTTTAGSEKNTFDRLFLICSRFMGLASVLKVCVGILNTKLIVDSCLNAGFVNFFRVYSVVTSLGNKPAKTKRKGKIYKLIVKTNTGVQSFSCRIKALWATKSQIRQIGMCWCKLSKNIEKLPFW